MRKRIHLLEVGLMWPPEVFLCRKLEALAARGLHVTVASAVSRRDASGVRLKGVELKRIPAKGESWRSLLVGVLLDTIALAISDPGRLAALVRAVRRSLPPASLRTRALQTLTSMRLFLPLARLRPDVVHFEWNGWAVAYLPLIEAWGRPVLTSCRGSAVNVRPLVPAYRDLARGLPATFELSAAVHCVSEQMVRTAERYGLDRSKARVIRPAVDPSFFSPSPNGSSAADRFRVAAVGMLRWQKGHEYALLAIRRLLDRGVPVRLDILGGEPAPGLEEVSDRERLLYTITDLGLEESVRLLGPASPEGVRAHLQRSHAFLHSSVCEGLPNVVVEAMACALPVVVTDAGGTREAVRDGVDGYVVPPRDPHGLASALEELWRDETLRRRMGRSGRSRVQAEFTLEHQARSFEALYREVVGSAQV